MSTIDRFLKAQEDDYETALSEIKRGKKSSCWMWYIFPQIKGLGKSEMSQKYEIKDIKWTSFGEEDFLDNFENLLLKDDLNKKSYSLIKLRKVFEDAKKNFTEKNPCKNEEFELILNKNDYEISCKEQFDQIVKLIKVVLLLPHPNNKKH